MTPRQRCSLERRRQTRFYRSTSTTRGTQETFRIERASAERRDRRAAFCDRRHRHLRFSANENRLFFFSVQQFSMYLQFFKRTISLSILIIS